MKTLIVANDYAESRELARRYELGPNQWRYVHSEQDVRGYRHPAVIMSSCFLIPAGGRRNGRMRAEEIYEALAICEARVALVPCRVD